jgi:hypothetical protein
MPTFPAFAAEVPAVSPGIEAEVVAEDEVDFTASCVSWRFVSGRGAPRWVVVMLGVTFFFFFNMDTRCAGAPLIFSDFAVSAASAPVVASPTIASAIPLFIINVPLPLHSLQSVAGLWVIALHSWKPISIHRGYSKGPASFKGDTCAMRALRDLK